ncbi:2Fe-2S iron-sulfur cluster binding domain-containing protein [Roseofilum sp. BLCC_M143]|uniref:2Fe-2S iron-sulfur cluster binding domain-containing protein n=2 Tax=Roseofilum TaxID=1233426 RepID=A0ABT7C222_9CYAN|nr:2Fe-2S iron-sulfur cluster binding domain-containing protein [Roseofilum casamattae]MDJ1185505.1 2Fe-2S iron-sulfur cluster binding domain-containing protein [Roseofilum casamattae BLCC-M143]
MENYYEESFGGAKVPKKSAAKPEVSTPAVPEAKPAPAVEAKVEPTPAPAPQPPPAPAASSAGATIVFKTSGKEVAVDGDDSILDVAEEHEIDIDSSCRTGACGTCKVKKLSGTVDYQSDPDALDESEVEQGYVLACIATAVGRVEIEA